MVNNNMNGEEYPSLYHGPPLPSAPVATPTGAPPQYGDIAPSPYNYTNQQYPVHLHTRGTPGDAASYYNYMHHTGGGRYHDAAYYPAVPKVEFPPEYNERIPQLRQNQPPSADSSPDSGISPDNSVYQAPQVRVKPFSPK